MDFLTGECTFTKSIATRTRNSKSQTFTKLSKRIDFEKV